MSTSQFFAVLALGTILFLLMVISSKEKTRALKNTIYGGLKKKRKLSFLRATIRYSNDRKKELAAELLIRLCEKNFFSKKNILLILQECGHQSDVNDIIIRSAKAFHKLFTNAKPALVEKIVSNFKFMSKEQILEIEWILNYGELKPK